ncbi:MAG: DUF1365 domain-containing protein [Proteobacteria bacterium]|nr:DUF1365 domain-containing protein [Pseudomonadota bacterium]
MHSCLYVGYVRHRRFGPKSHNFTYPLFMVCLDLAELDSVFAERWLWSINKPNLATFNRSDYFGDPAITIDQAIRDFVADKTGTIPTGPIRLLTHLRYFGFSFNPVSIYYCFDSTAEHVETIVAEITNTPWNERHSYVLGQSADEGSERHHRYRFDKDFHVSPFFPMDIAYDWRFGEPGEKLTVHMQLLRDNAKIFDATLDLNRTPMSAANMAWALLRYPLMTGQVLAAIYYHAARIKLKGIPFFDHP